MPHWKTDPLYREIFAEVHALWDEVDEASRPMLYRVEERSEGSTRPREVWIYDDAGFRVVSILRREPPDFGARRGEFFEFGLVWFAIAADRRKVRLGYRLGPRVTGEIGYEVERDGDRVFLMADTGSLSF